MILATILLAMQSEPIGFESYISKLGVPKTFEDLIPKTKSYQFRGTESSLVIKIDFTPMGSIDDIDEEIDKRIDGIRKFSALWTELTPDRYLIKDGRTLGYKLLTFLNPSGVDSRINIWTKRNAYQFHIYGRLDKGERRGEVVRVEPVPSNTYEIASNIATLFIAEHEAKSLAETVVTLSDRSFRGLVGPDSTEYIPLPDYCNSNNLEFSLHPHTGIGRIESTHPVIFNLACMDYSVGDTKHRAQNVVVLKNGIAYLPKEMLSK